MRSRAESYNSGENTIVGANLGGGTFSMQLLLFATHKILVMINMNQTNFDIKKSHNFHRMQKLFVQLRLQKPLTELSIVDKYMLFDLSAIRRDC